jgi:hypothetical protein
MQECITEKLLAILFVALRVILNFFPSKFVLNGCLKRLFQNHLAVDLRTTQWEGVHEDLFIGVQTYFLSLC